MEANYEEEEINKENGNDDTVWYSQRDEVGRLVGQGGEDDGIYDDIVSGKILRSTPLFVI